jgi:hypothetical protein
MKILLHTKLKLGFVEKDSSYEGRITLSGDKLEDNIKMNPHRNTVFGYGLDLSVSEWDLCAK